MRFNIAIVLLLISFSSLAQKKITIAVSADTSSLSNRINQKVNIADTASMLNNYRTAINLKATQIALDDTAAALRAISGGGGSGVTSGTYADRIALSSPTTGKQFYQTNERIGLWQYNGFGWEHLPTNLRWHFITNLNLAAWYTRTLSGAGTSIVWTQTGADSVLGTTMLHTTGSTATGSAIGITNSLNDYQGGPLDTAYRMVVYYRLKVGAAPSTSQNYRLFFGSKNTSGLTTDSTGYGVWFRMAYHHNDTYIQCFSVTGSGATFLTTTTVPIASLNNTFHDYTIVYNIKNVDYYIDGVLVATHHAGVSTFSGGAPFVSLIKLLGTTSIETRISDIKTYVTKTE